MPSAKAANSIMGRVRTDPPRSCGSLTRCLRNRAADTPAPDAGRLAVLALEAAVEGLLGVKAEGNRHVQDRLVAVGQAFDRLLQLFRPNIFSEGLPGMFFEDPLQVPLRIAGSSGNGVNIQTAIKMVVDPVDQILNDGASVLMLPPRGRLKASLSVAFKGGLFLHKMQVLLLHLNPRRDRGFLSPLDRT